MFGPIRKALQLLTVVWNPHPDERPFLDRAQTREDANIKVTVAALSIRESERFFGVKMAKRGMQPLWIEIVNNSSHPQRLDLVNIDAAYYTPMEAAYVNHYSTGKRLFSYGLLSLLFVWLTPLLPFKIIGARLANGRINPYFKKHGFRSGPILPGTTRSGFVFVSLDEGTKIVNIRLIAENNTWQHQFTCEVPGLDIKPDDEVVDTGALEETDEATLRAWIERQPRCTTNMTGRVEGDPMNLVVVGDRTTVLRSFGARWDEAESITFATCWKTTKAFLFSSEYRYSPVSPMYHDGRSEDLALQKARAVINERHASTLVADDEGARGQGGLDRPGQPGHRRALHIQDVESYDPPHRRGRGRGSRLCDRLSHVDLARCAGGLRRGRGRGVADYAPPQHDGRSVFHRRIAGRPGPVDQKHPGHVLHLDRRRPGTAANLSGALPSRVLQWPRPSWSE